MGFSLPADVTVTKQQLEGQWVYSFRHDGLGELGRIVLQGLSTGQCHIVSEVIGDPKDPMTEKRQAILQPISEQLTAALTSVTGEGDQTPLQSAPASPKAPREIVESKLMPCDRCGHNAAMLIFAYDAKTVADFENYARKMYVKYSDLNVPTWIIGEALGTPGLGTPSRILKVWPHRESIRKITPNDFNAELDELIANHCV